MIYYFSCRTGQSSGSCQRSFRRNLENCWKDFFAFQIDCDHVQRMCQLGLRTDTSRRSSCRKAHFPRHFCHCKLSLIIFNRWNLVDSSFIGFNFAEWSQRRYVGLCWETGSQFHRQLEVVVYFVVSSIVSYCPYIMIKLVLCLNNIRLVI